MNPSIISLGTHRPILQSMLDFDFYCGRATPMLQAIIGTGKKFEKFFFGKREVLIPVYSDLDNLNPQTRASINGVINVNSGRRTLSAMRAAIATFPNLKVAVLFAENVPEKHSLEIYELAKNKNITITGPASVGILIPRHLKIGPIGGVDHRQLLSAKLFETGATAVLCSSGGMTNEIINLLANANIPLSFAIAFGGDRFPVLTPQEAFLAAQNDPNTKQIVYFGELGGYDEYELAELLKKKIITKPIIAYIAGSVSAVFKEPPQFGHAKALAQHGAETASAKAEALTNAGALVGKSFAQFLNLITKNIMPKKSPPQTLTDLSDRRASLFTCRISGDVNGSPTILGQELVSAVKTMSYSEMVIALLLGKKPQSKELAQFTDLALKLLIDHGPYVSGAVNTMITARAGKDLVSSLCAGLLTIGDRFGGAINEAALNWFTNVATQTNPSNFVEKSASAKKIIAGIGHKKYSSQIPDERVKLILEFAKKIKSHPHLDFARAVEKITLAKKANLILNVDGALAAVLLDLLQEKENYKKEELSELIASGFFNSLFILARSVGFAAHFLEQRRLDEGLFRLPEDSVNNG